MSLRNEVARRRAALAYIQRNHPLLTMKLAMGAPLNGMGDFWSDLRDKTVGNVSTQVKTQVDAATEKLKTAIGTGDKTGEAQAGGMLSQLLGPSTATALYNIFRIEKGKEPVQVADVVGASKESQAIRFVPIAIGVAVVLWGVSKLTK